MKELLEKQNVDAGLAWKVLLGVIAAFLVLSVIMFIRRSAALGCLAIAICIAIFILGNSTLGKFTDAAYKMSVGAAEKVSGQSEEELKERGESALEDIKDAGDKVKDFITN